MDHNPGNDTRGWILASVSGIACVFGACIICVDFVVRLLPGMKGFEIKRSDTFLSSSLSLSFGVMLFSSLYSMLPEAKNSLMDGGMSKSRASYTLIGCFLGGVIGIQLVSRLFHHFIPSHVVGCEHHHHDAHHEGSSQGHTHDDRHEAEHGLEDESDRQVETRHTQGKRRGRLATQPLIKTASESDALLGGANRPRLAPLKTRVSSLLVGRKPTCDEEGPCRGFTDPCGNECFASPKASPTIPNASYGTATRSVRGRDQSSTRLMSGFQENPEGDRAYNTPDQLSGSTATSPRSLSPDLERSEAKDHHHHVANNPFLSIGLQTSLAIALHKLPEGFITYATNHANPQLGFSIFVALFIHNITEGFALALPLFLAINSRWKAILASALLGGASQPLGRHSRALVPSIEEQGHQARRDGVWLHVCGDFWHHDQCGTPALQREPLPDA